MIIEYKKKTKFYSTDFAIFNEREGVFLLYMTLQGGK